MPAFTPVRAPGWYPIRATEFIARARNLHPFIEIDDPAYADVMLERLHRSKLVVHWPLAGERVHEAPRDFEFEIQKSWRIVFLCRTCTMRPKRVSGAGKNGRSFTAWVHPTEQRLWCPRCLFDRRVPAPRYVDQLGERVAQFAAYRFNEHEDPLEALVGGRGQPLSPILSPGGFHR